MQSLREDNLFVTTRFFEVTVSPVDLVSCVPWIQWFQHTHSHPGYPHFVCTRLFEHDKSSYTFAIQLCNNNGSHVYTYMYTTRGIRKVVRRERERERVSVDSEGGINKPVSSLISSLRDFVVRSANRDRHVLQPATHQKAPAYDGNRSGCELPILLPSCCLPLPFYHPNSAPETFPCMRGGAPLSSRGTHSVFGHIERRISYERTVDKPGAQQHYSTIKSYLFMIFV